jgi:hypothetical protein
VNPLEQHEVLSAITVSLVEALPADGSHVHVSVPKTLAPHFRRLREGDDWHRLELIIDPPGAFHVRFHR